MSTKDGVAIERLAQVLADPTGTLTRRRYHAKVFALAMQWPSLAAVIGDLLAENDQPIPGPLRQAQNSVKHEGPRT